MAEQIERASWGNGPAQPQALARFLSERDRSLAEALQLAEEAVVTRRDIYTMDTLAWAQFKAGRLAEARTASEQALRTSTRDARILYHAAEIRAAAGERDAALLLLSQLPAPDAVADVLVSRGIKALRARLSS